MSGTLTLRQAAIVPLEILKNAAYDPLITGGLLWALTRGPVSLRERILRPFRKGLIQHLPKVIELLKALVVIGTWKRIDQVMTRLALNDWRLRSKGAEWNFDVAKSEVVVVTGGCSGFGYEMVKGFSKVAKVVIIDIADLPAEFAALSDVHYYKCDLSDLNAITSITEAIKNQHGNPTVLINNAGIANTFGQTVRSTDIKSLQKIFNVNLLSHFILIRNFLPGMFEARKGHIVTISSTAGFLGRAALLDYSVTKAGAMALHEGLRDQLLTMCPGDHRIRTTIVHPNWHATAMLKPIAHVVKSGAIRPDPPTNVSNAIIDQVITDRSGQLIIPSRQSRAKTLRTMPIWVRDLMNGNVFPVPMWMKC